MIKLMTPNLWHLKFILFIDSFPKIISPVCQLASQANKSGNEPANQSISFWLLYVYLPYSQSVSQSVIEHVSQSIGQKFCY